MTGAALPPLEQGQMQGRPLPDEEKNLSDHLLASKFLQEFLSTSWLRSSKLLATFAIKFECGQSKYQTLQEKRGKIHLGTYI